MNYKKGEAATESLIIFTRYPEPGKTKTRLIPAIGAEGAANIGGKMTEHTLNQVKELQSLREVAVAVYFAGGNTQLMQQWLGANLRYQCQGEGDLGSRMALAFAKAFEEGSKSVVIIGTDCPSLKPKLMEDAFQELTQHDLVLGPAQDGGYYLIGLRRFIPELFTGINWGTSSVLQQTVTIGKQLDLALAYLPTLADVDRPEDLLILDQTNLRSL
ncbi:MAG: TIGR04282 family arsenosugar biosynthesis glycosyltransferase [Crinalium sp.]